MTLCLDVLLSYAYHRDTDLGAIRDALGPDAVLVVDSGAFTAYTKGRVIDLNDYARFCEQWADVIDYAVTLDVIGDHEGTRRNTDALHERGIGVVPVFTMGTPLNELDRLAKEGHRLVYVGGLVPLTRQRTILANYLRAVNAYAANLGLMVHALGVGGVATVQATGVYSGDSSSATQAPAFGAVCVWNGRSQAQVKVSDKVGLSKHREWLSGCGAPLTAMITGDVYGKAQRSSRDDVVKVGLWSYVVAGAMSRHRAPRVAEGFPVGPRILAAASNGDIKPVMEVGLLARTSPPPAVVKATRATLRSTT